MRNMLFDLRPKASRDELFDREKELGILDGSVGKPLIVVA
ncbi:MAG: ATPase, partial [Nitrososphaera sp.]